MNTRKHPRTLEEAFGPYARGPIEKPLSQRDRQDRIVVIASAIAAVALLVMAVAGWLPGGGA